MKKLLFAALFLSAASTIIASPVMLEVFQDHQITIPFDIDTSLTVVEISFSVDTACYVQFNTGGNVSRASMSLVLDGETLWPESKTGAVYPFTFSIPYSVFVTTGQHSVLLKLTTNMNQDYNTTCSKAYLQALIFLPDTGNSAVTEAPEVEPVAQTASVISKGPYVSAPGALELVDASGRVIENAIAEDRVQISTLPPGTYFARDGERTVVKIVKVE